MGNLRIRTYFDLTGIIFIMIILLTSIFYSCNKVIEKGKIVVEKTERTIKDKSQNLMDKVNPRFDPYTPDTKFNKQRFKDFLKVDLSSDVKNIYCFDDALGPDADYQFSFNCDTTTVNRIINKNRLKLDTVSTDFAFGIQHDFVWWDKEKIKKLKLYSWKEANEYYKYFWYDTTESKAYFFDFDL